MELRNAGEVEIAPFVFLRAQVALLVYGRILADRRLFCIDELGVFYELGMMGTWWLWFPPVSGVSEVSEPKEPLWKSGVKGIINGQEEKWL